MIDVVIQILLLIFGLMVVLGIIVVVTTIILWVWDFIKRRFCKKENKNE